MRIATWNLNNRVGKTRFRLDAAEAAIALGVDVLVLPVFSRSRMRLHFVPGYLMRAGLTS